MSKIRGHTERWMSRLLAGAVFLIVLLMIPRALAQSTITWSGGGGSNWSVNTNWGGNPPSSGGTYNFIFATGNQLTNYNNVTSLTAASLVFSNTAGGFVLGGNSLTLGGGITNKSANLQTINLNLNLSASETVATTSGNITIGGVISGAHGLTSTGPGTLTLSGANTYSGGTILNSGTVAINTNLALGAGALTFAGNSTLTALAGLTTTSGLNNALVIDTNVTATLNIPGTNELVLSNAVSGAGALAISAGTGTLTMEGLNSYTGGTTLNGGTVQIYTTNTFGTGAVTFASDSTLRDLGNRFITNGIVIDSGVTATLDSAGYNFTNSGSISGTGGLTSTGTGTLTLTAANTYSGGTILDAGTLALANSSGLGSGGATFASNSSILAAESVLYLSNNLVINSGVTATLKAGAANVIDLSDAISGAGTLSLTGNETIFTTSNSYTGGTILNGTLAAYTTPNAFGTGAITVASNSTLQSLNNVTLSNAAVISTNATLTLNGNQGNTYSGTISGSGSLISASTGYTTELTASNSFTGTTTVSSGNLLLANSYALGGSTFDSSGSGYLSFGTLTNATFGGLQGSGNLALTNSSGTRIALTAGGNNQNTTFSGVVSGTSASLTKVGSGTLTLTGNNTFTGSTTVNSGALSLSTNGAFSGTTNVVVNGGTLLLGGSNSINTNANLTLGGGTLSMGAGTNRAPAQILNTLTLTANSVIDFANLSGISFLTFSSIVGLTTYTLSVYDWNGTTAYGITSTTGGVGQTTSLIDLSGLTAAQLANISFYSGFGTGFLGTGLFSSSNQIIPVPEPSVVISSLLLLGWLIFLPAQDLALAILIRACGMVGKRVEEPV